MEGIALKYIGQNEDGDSPAFEFATKGQKLLIIEDLTKNENLSGFQKDYKYVCQDTKKDMALFMQKMTKLK